MQDLLQDDAPNQATIALIRTLEQHCYVHMTELIDAHHLDAARQVADLMQVVGII